MAMSRSFFLGALVALTTILSSTEGHGRLMDPAARGTMWRKGFRTPVNYNDNQLNCGGRWSQFGQNGGRCGPCGDDFSMPRPRMNENTGVYGRGVVSKTFTSGQEITATVDLTANHKGWFEFRVCPLASKKDMETEECFSRFPLQLANGSGSRFIVPDYKPGQYQVKLRLPSGLRCEQCVLRWEYRAGNSWGVCPDGTGAIGCGDQETFRNCADIAIL
ncbi:uncharacterized protein LOC124168442 [Ischnura elegans]|uniref:uncharacterized protein LOC124168442 n=1 Tax=Ischnura elegans TaxID=197161 RepID=UPI001ED87812|nr:uncharacterized protein LOC124168442 [Ischnura elegans]